MLQLRRTERMIEVEGSELRALQQRLRQLLVRHIEEADMDRKSLPCAKRREKVDDIGFRKREGHAAAQARDATSRASAAT